jgi:hypothetical protein
VEGGDVTLCDSSSAVVQATRLFSLCLSKNKSGEGGGTVTSSLGFQNVSYAIVLN